MTFSGTPILAGTQLPPGTQLKVLAVMRNLGSVPTPSCNARCTATGNGVSTATVPPLPVAGSYTVPFPTPITLRQATGWTGTVLVEANFDAGLAPHGRWFQEQSYANNQGTCSFALKKPTLFP